MWNLFLKNAALLHNLHETSQFWGNHLEPMYTHSEKRAVRKLRGDEWLIKLTKLLTSVYSSVRVKNYFRKKKLLEFRCKLTSQLILCLFSIPKMLPSYFSLWELRVSFLLFLVNPSHLQTILLKGDLLTRISKLCVMCHLGLHWLLHEANFAPFQSEQCHGAHFDDPIPWFIDLSSLYVVDHRWDKSNWSANHSYMTSSQMNDKYAFKFQDNCAASNKHCVIHSMSTCWYTKCWRLYYMIAVLGL